MAFTLLLLAVYLFVVFIQQSTLILSHYIWLFSPFFTLILMLFLKILLLYLSILKHYFYLIIFFFLVVVILRLMCFTYHHPQKNHELIGYFQIFNLYFLTYWRFFSFTFIMFIQIKNPSILLISNISINFQLNMICI